MAKRSLQLQRRCAYFLSECLRLGWKKADLPGLEKIWWKYKPWKKQKDMEPMAVAIGRHAMRQAAQREKDEDMADKRESGVS